MTPQTRYARSGDVNIAYQVVGDASRDLVLVPGWVTYVRHVRPAVRVPSRVPYGAGDQVSPAAAGRPA